ncbi:MAG TPA: TetR/AcrR family transcriptional regulator [Bryobacteraceae bacterium]|jgi:AcrR family transcriptional regulator|nr:TetR/AcrR family transcriptional regulator [Bryobacteraceae bacterium]
MSSHLAPLGRRVPQQQRGRERVAALLDAAEQVLAETGYDAATMSAIAARAGASIGSLYQFFPSKDSITDCLRDKYCDELRGLWVDSEEKAGESIEELVKRLLDEVVLFLDDRPALLALLTEPCKTKNTSLQDLLRERLARILRGGREHLSKTRAHFLASVVLQVMKGMNELYAEFESGKRKALVKEYERLLTSYLAAELEPEAAVRRKKS